jgi:tetratricopeptide (TPR) repeat protein/TolB-like protein
MRKTVPNARSILYLCLLLVLSVTPVPAQQTAAVGSQQGVYLVFPFENAGSSPHLDWLGEGLEELTIRYLSDAGEQVYSRAGRAGELERYGLPYSAKLSRATMLRIAQDLDADYVVFGTFTSDGTSLTVEARVLRIDPPSLLAPVRETAPLSSLMELHNTVVYRLLSANQQHYPLTLADFTKRQHSLRLDAFEHFVRGLLLNEDEPRIRELKEAARLEPTWPDPAFALGETYAARNDCASALPWLAKVPKTNRRYVEALFTTGVCRLQLNQPEQAEEVFIALQATVSVGSQQQPEAATTAVAGGDLPELLNNLAVALARQGKTPAAQADLRRATELDPDEDDYPFNLGLLAFRSSEYTTAATLFREASEREPDNAEDRALLIQALEKSGRDSEADEEREAATEALGPGALPTIHLDAKGDAAPHLERIKTELDITALRLEIQSSGPPAASATAAGNTAMTPSGHIRIGHQDLTAGSLDAAETEFRAALAADPGSYAAHQGLAEVDRRRGKFDDAVTELQASIQSRDSAFVRTLLAKVYLDQKKFDLARAQAEYALKLAPNYAQAKQLLDHLQNSKPKASSP